MEMHDNRDVYLLNLHEELSLYGDNDIQTKVIRVPGGWIYRTEELIPSEDEWLVTSAVFVPYNEEFRNFNMD